MNINDVKAKAYDSIVTTYYSEKLSMTFVEALITMVNQFEMKPIKEEKKEEPKAPALKVEVVEEKKAEPKKATKKATGRKSTVDKGKIKACFEGGWPIAKIADEMGLDKSTITYHLKNMGLK